MTVLGKCEDGSPVGTENVKLLPAYSDGGDPALAFAIDQGTKNAIGRRRGVFIISG
jgi:hypothetical protein